MKMKMRWMRTCVNVVAGNVMVARTLENMLAQVLDVESSLRRVPSGCAAAAAEIEGEEQKPRRDPVRQEPRDVLLEEGLLVQSSPPRPHSDSEHACQSDRGSYAPCVPIAWSRWPPRSQGSLWENPSRHQLSKGSRRKNSVCCSSRPKSPRT